MWLILSDQYDRSGAWLARSLPSLTTQTVVHVTSDDLSRAPRWEHRLTADSAWFRFTTANQRTIDSREVRGVINRLWSLSSNGVSALRPADRFYALQEKGALLLSCLHTFSCPMLNPPGAQGLSGDFRLPFEWAALAQRAGLRCRPQVHTWSTMQSPSANIDAPERRRLLVVGDHVLPVGDLTVPSGLTAAALRLSRLAACPLLEITFVEVDGAWRFIGANAFPDLAAIGETVLPLLTAALGEPLERIPTVVSRDEPETNAEPSLAAAFALS